MAVVMLFVDGIGIGEPDPASNPIARFPSPFLSIFKGQSLPSLPFDGLIVPTDPRMDVPGLPQSATGQTALLTGVNAAQALGRHVSGFPGPTLRKILAADSIFLKLERAGRVGTFINAFTPEYFERPARRISATTWSLRASSFPFRMVEQELQQDRAISHDLTNEFLAQLGYRVPIRTPQRSAEILAEIAGSVDFCLFEFILTDLVGHRGDLNRAEVVLQRLNAFLETLLSRVDLNRHTVLLTSDHGNFEDLSVSTHTTNPVPTLVWGKDRHSLADRIQRIEDVPGAILSLLSAATPA